MAAEPSLLMHPSRKEGLFWKLLHHIECGLHSGYKPCCIAYFCLVKEPFYKLINSPHLGNRYPKIVRGLDKLHYKIFFAHKQNSSKAWLGYVACPLCNYRDHFVDVKSCPSEWHIDGKYPGVLEKEEIDYNETITKEDGKQYCQIPITVQIGNVQRVVNVLKEIK